MLARRRFLQHTLLSSASLALGVSAVESKKNLLVCGFTKHLQGLSFADIASIAAEVGLDGIEAPVRPGGHVEPDRVVEDLPKLVEALSHQKLQLTILTSGINQVSKEQNTEQVLRTAKALGIERFRMLYFKYDLKKPIEQQLSEWKPKIHDLVQLCEEIGIQPLLQNHSGKDYFGAPIWDAWSLMKDYTPTQWGFALDTYHTTVEAGLSWPIDVSLIRSHIQALYLKDVKWLQAGKADGVPLGSGMVPRAMVSQLLKTGFNGPVSLHTEYMKGDAAGDPQFVKDSIAAFKRDLAVVREWLTPAA
jgi:sugar phosphate isomerase/epimerase